VRYRIAIFKEGAQAAAAQGHFVHVYVDRETQKPVEIPPETRAMLSELT
jgi:acyl-CoA thioester hydrolase